MEKDDALIRELLEKGMLKSAPNGFTDKVMDSIAAEEIADIRETSPLVYAGIFAGAIGILVTVLYFVSPTIFERYSSYFKGIMLSAIAPFSNIFDGFTSMQFGMSVNNMLFGSLLVVGLLLIVDQIVSKGRKYTGIFV